MRRSPAAALKREPNSETWPEPLVRARDLMCLRNGAADNMERSGSHYTERHLRRQRHSLNARQVLAPLHLHQQRLGEPLLSDAHRLKLVGSELTARAEDSVDGWIHSAGDHDVGGVEPEIERDEQLRSCAAATRRRSGTRWRAPLALWPVAPAPCSSPGFRNRLLPSQSHRSGLGPGRRATRPAPVPCRRRGQPRSTVRPRTRARSRRYRRRQGRARCAEPARARHP